MDIVTPPLPAFQQPAASDTTTASLFNFEHALRLGASHLESMVDSQGRTYFDVFATQPAEAVTDWPDFVDLPARYLEAAAMVAPALGRPVSTVPALRRGLFATIRPDGLAYRPDGPISHPVAELFDQSRLLYALVTCVMADPADDAARRHLRNLCAGLHRRASHTGNYAFIDQVGVYFGGTLIRPLVQAGLVLQAPQWIEFAAALARGIVEHSTHFAPDGAFKGHAHGHLGTAAGFLACGIVTGDRALQDRARTIFDWARSVSTPFGFVPEVAQRQDDLIACETCTLMDYLDLALLLARHVDGAYWDVVEKAARNHLLESQIRDASWLAESAGATDEDGVIRDRLRAKLHGAFAGWSAPHAALAYEEQFWPGWVRSPELQARYLGKVRAVQNCCAGGGIRALHQVWSNIVQCDGRTLQVNLLLDKAIPEAVVTSFLPHEGRVRVDLRRAGRLRIRIPAGTPTAAIATTRNGVAHTATPDGFFLDLGEMTASDVVEMRFPVPHRTEAVVVGNAGFQQYRFRAEWRGDTVMAMTADPGNPTTGYSDPMKKTVRLFYGPDAPGHLYRRPMSPPDAGTRIPDVTDAGTIDWYRLGQ